MATDIFSRWDSVSFAAIREVRITVNPAFGCWVLTLQVERSITPHWLDGLSVQLLSEENGVAYPCTPEWCDRTGSLITAYLWPVPGQPVLQFQGGQSTRFTPFSEVWIRSRTGSRHTYANIASRRGFLRRKT